MDDQVVVGSRVRVRFSGQLVDGVVADRVDTSDHAGRLAYLERALSAEPVLSAEIAGAARDIADRSAGTLTDVLRLAIPPRHAAAESATWPAPENPVPPVQPSTWAAYPAGPGFVTALAGGRAPRAVWSVLPGDPWPALIAEAVTATVLSGRGAVVVVPDARDLDRLDAALSARLGVGHHVTVSASLGPAERYRRWLAVRRGQVRAAIGTRAASFAPVADLGLVVIWDDGDDLHVEPRSPYCHAREVLLVRAQRAGAAALVAGFARSCEAQLLVTTGWAKNLVADRALVRERTPRIVPLDEDSQLAADAAASSARLPTVAWKAARAALAAGAPVLVQVPRRGYLPSLACRNCRTPARCRECAGPLGLPMGGDAVASCRWCGHLAGDWTCPSCSGRGLRASVVGARRTAEELGKAFPGVTVRTSGRDGVLATVAAEPALVVSTPGAEPVADGGYGAALLLDTWALLSRADLRAAEEALRRWSNVIGLVRPAGAGGQVVITADAGLPVIQALVRWDPAGFAERELSERAELGFPPAVRMASLTGTAEAVADLIAVADLPADTDVLGPVPIPQPPQRDPDSPEVERTLLRVSRSAAPKLAAALHAAMGVRSARKAPSPVRVEIDPLDLF